MDKEFEMLLNEAKKIAHKVKLNKNFSYGSVACALLTKDGNIYTGVSTEIECSLGTCSERSAIAEMVKHNESEIVKIVAYAAKGAVYPPCGVCREMIRMVNEKNLEAEVMVGDNKVVKVKDLLPDIFISKSTEE